MTQDIQGSAPFNISTFFWYFVEWTRQEGELYRINVGRWASIYTVKSNGQDTPNLYPHRKTGRRSQLARRSTYFDARNDPLNAPVAIYLSCVPGVSSSFAALGENGPCYANRDSNSTQLHPWSFNNHVNMPHIGQPNQVGFSYDTIISGTYDVIEGNIYPITFLQNETFISGKFPS